MRFVLISLQGYPKAQETQNRLFLPAHSVQPNTALTPPRSDQICPPAIPGAVWDLGWGSEHSVPCTSNCPIILPQGFIQLHSTPLSFGKIRLSHVAHDSCLRPTDLPETRCWGLEVAAPALTQGDWSWDRYLGRGDKASVFSVSDLMKSAGSSHTKFSQH